MLKYYKHKHGEILFDVGLLGVLGLKVLRCDVKG